MGWAVLWRQSDRATETVYYECRLCGTAVESEHEECPVCESDSIATYKLA